ncbi:MAG: glycosyl hydrolase family 18 protein, partial [Anaerolineae bacterium]
SRREFRVVGYATAWSGRTREIPFEHLTHIHYAFLLPHPRGDGSLLPIQNPDKLKNLVAAAREHDVKVLIAVGGWNGGNDLGFETLAARPETIRAFAKNLTAFCDQYGLNGVDIDWEYPDPGESARNYAAMMGVLAEEMRSRGRLLTAAVIGRGPVAEGVPDEVFGYVDYIGIMAYDGGEGPEHSPYEYAVEALDYWLGRGLPPEKAVLGIPFYGRPKWLEYRVLLSLDPDAPYKNMVIADGVPVYYNGIPTVQAKTRLALERAGGVMVWELAQDSPGELSLLRAIHQMIQEYEGK